MAASRSIGGVRRRRFRTAGIWSPNDPTGPRFRIEDIYPCVDCGRYPIKRIAGESVEVWADIFREGHDVLAAALIWRDEDAETGSASPCALFGNDRWHGQLHAARARLVHVRDRGLDRPYATWRKEFLLKQEAGQDVSLDAREGTS